MENIWEETPNIFHFKSYQILFILQDAKRTFKNELNSKANAGNSKRFLPLIHKTWNSFWPFCYKIGRK